MTAQELSSFTAAYYRAADPSAFKAEEQSHGEAVRTPSKEHKS